MIQYYVSAELGLEYYDLIEKFPSVALKHSLVGCFLSFFFFFLMCIVFKVFIEFVITWLLFFLF